MENNMWTSPVMSCMGGRSIAREWSILFDLGVWGRARGQVHIWMFSGDKGSEVAWRVQGEC